MSYPLCQAQVHCLLHYVARVDLFTAVCCIAARNVYHPYLPGKLTGNLDSASQVPCGEATHRTRTIDGTCNYTGRHTGSPSMVSLILMRMHSHLKKQLLTVTVTLTATADTVAAALAVC
jgi:hypothetical protein